MKIAVLTTYFNPEENGLTRYINGLYGVLLEKHPEIEIDVIAFDTLKTKNYRQKTKNWTIYRIDCIPILGRTYAIPTRKGKKQLRDIFQKNSYDLINTHTRFFLTSYYGIKMGKKYGIPVIHTEHGSGFVKHNCKAVEWIAKIYDLTLGKYVLKNADLVCGVSQSACRFAKKLGAKKTGVVYNGINVKFWQNTPSFVSPLVRGRNSGDSETVFTFVGRLIPEKGVQDLIEVLKILNTPPPRLERGYSSQEENGIQSPLERGVSARGEDGVCEFNWKLFIIGDGFYRKELEKLVKKYQLEDKILFLGAKNQKEVRDILKTTDLFINPSLASEGLPTTILEAAACDCRVLSSDKGGSIEVLTKESLYKAGDLDALKKKILSYNKIPVPNVDKFDWKLIAEKYYRLLSTY